MVLLNLDNDYIKKFDDFLIEIRVNWIAVLDSAELVGEIFEWVRGSPLPNGRE